MKKLLQVIKTHGGPVICNDLDNLEKLTDKQVLDEVRYLRHTIAPNIREKRKVENKFVKYTKAELITQIKNVLKQETEVEDNVDKLLFNSLVKKLPELDQSLAAEVFQLVLLLCWKVP